MTLEQIQNLRAVSTGAARSFFDNVCDYAETHNQYTQKLLAEFDLSWTNQSEKIYRILNEPKSPLRNALIIWSISPEENAD